jgi:hypothetical protein
MKYVNQLPIFIGIICLILLGIILAIFWSKPNSDNNSKDNQKVFYESKTSLEEETEYHYVKADYPITNKPWINSNITAFVTQAIDLVKENKDLKEEDKGVIGEGMKDKQYWATITYEKFETPNTVSYLLKSNYNTGSAHPNISQETLNYRIPSGEKVNLEDLFNDSKIGIEFIQKSAEEKIKAKLKNTDQNLLDEGLSNIDNLRNFIIKNGTISFVFDPYIVSSYASGPIEIEYSKDELSSYLKDEWK